MTVSSINTHLIDMATQEAHFCRVVVDPDAGEVRAYETTHGSLVATAKIRDVAHGDLLRDVHGAYRFHGDSKTRWICLKHLNQLPRPIKDSP